MTVRQYAWPAMASLVLKMSVSLDGFVAPIEGAPTGSLRDAPMTAPVGLLETLSNARAHLMGATTYAEWAGDRPGASGPFAKPMNEIPKVVFSDSLASADWGETTIATGDLAGAITRLKQERSADTCSPTAGRGSPDRWSRSA